MRAADGFAADAEDEAGLAAGHGFVGNGVGGHGGLAIGERDFFGEGFAEQVASRHLTLALSPVEAERETPGVDEDGEVGFPPVVVGEEFAEFVHLGEVQALVQVAQGDGGAVFLGRAGLRVHGERDLFEVFGRAEDGALGDGEPGAGAVGFGLDFHRLGEDQAGELADAAPAFDDAQEVGRALAFAAEAGTGDVQVVAAEFLLFHPAAVVSNDDGGVGEDVGQGDVDLGGFSVPGVVNEFAQGTFAGGVALAQDGGEAGINAERGGGGHGMGRREPRAAAPARAGSCFMVRTPAV